MTNETTTTATLRLISVTGTGSRKINKFLAEKRDAQQDVAPVAAVAAPTVDPLFLDEAVAEWVESYVARWETFVSAPTAALDLATQALAEKVVERTGKSATTTAIRHLLGSLHERAIAREWMRLS